MKKVPFLLIAIRLLLGFVMILIANSDFIYVRLILVLLMILGLLTDIFDGIIARKVGVSSEKLRRMDSQVDLIFWLCVGWCAWLLNPEIILDHKYAIISIFVMEGLTYVFSILKFGKETCTHALLSKLWGITLLAAFVSMIGFGHAGIPFFLAVFFGITGHIDVYLIIYFLPIWTHDVPSSYHAYLIRTGKTIKKHKWFNG
ncbi:CDP-alcohol phosphatidyltransferase family protein [Flavobacterium psychroterrae]|uniref:CDP-alcohol phosphatidyltransferase family protein n=1 Tax=Flavobacterium psychroterrae TaxID=2133767 RepID=A0ABS5P6D5_9FLAO|nr:CDP-alcohol phosphatidyltransferase family protein [Flavobacterium psychroterrae]MBS7229841.1 CDP-alcohol phosphatidyltransferase family protein [Flavobacterium psychroterrae]